MDPQTQNRIKQPNLVIGDEGEDLDDLDEKSLSLPPGLSRRKLVNPRKRKRAKTPKNAAGGGAKRPLTSSAAAAAEITTSDGTVVQVKKEVGTFDEDDDEQPDGDNVESLPNLLEVDLKEEKVDDSLGENWLEKGMAEGQDGDGEEEDDLSEEEPSDLATSEGF